MAGLFHATHPSICHLPEAPLSATRLDACSRRSCQRPGGRAPLIHHDNLDVPPRQEDKGDKGTRGRGDEGAQKRVVPQRSPDGPAISGTAVQPKRARLSNAASPMGP